MATVVFVNEEDQSVMIVDGKTVQVISWRNLNVIAGFLRGKEVYYVTAAEYVKGDEIVGLLSEVTSQEVEDIGPSQQYMRSKLLGKVIIPGVDGGEMIFQGPTDFWSMDRLKPDFLKRFPMLKSMLDSGKVEFVDETEKARIIAELEQKRSRLTNAKEKFLDQMLVRTTVDDFLKNRPDDDSGVITIDVSSEGSFKRDRDQESYANLKSLGIETEG